MTDGKCRLGGLLCLAGAVISTMIHRAIYQAVGSGPATAGEFGAGLLTFVLACAGILLLLHGASLVTPAGAGEGQGGDDGSADQAAVDSRHDVAAMLARRALAAARTAHAAAATLASAPEAQRAPTGQPARYPGTAPHPAQPFTVSH